MLVLGLDTALQHCSAAILRDGELLAERVLDMTRGHAEHLAPMVADVLGEAHVKVNDLDRVGVVVGPGGFTGVRVGLAFARGLGVGGGVSIVGVTSLAALAANEKVETGFVASLIDARRSQIYGALYTRKGEVAVAPFVSSPEEALARIDAQAGEAPVRLIGSGASLLPDPPPNWGHSDGSSVIDPKIVAALASVATPSGPPAPLYLRAPDAKPQKPPLVTSTQSR